MVQLFAGRFALIDRIGEGASGTVWRAYDTRGQRYCAAKLIRQRDADSLLRVVREQGVRLAHPHVVCPYGWAADDDVVIAMDLVAGGSLTNLIRDHGPLPAGYAARILVQLLDALAQVHSAGLVHRDVKPANVLLEVTGTGPPHSRLGDFGIAQHSEDSRLTQLGQVIGTPGYLPPEALAGAPPDPSRDLYAAGVVGWQLLTGAEQPPARIHVDDRPDQVPHRLWAVVTDLLAPDPRQRPAGAVEATAAVAAILRGADPPLPTQADDDLPIEVFDLLGPLPSGSAGPGPARSATPNGTVIQPTTLLSAPVPRGPVHGVRPLSPGAPPLVHGALSPGVPPLVHGALSPGALSPVPGGQPHGGWVPGSPGSPSGVPVRRRRFVLPALAAGAVVVLIATAAVLVDQVRGRPGSGPGPSASAPGAATDAAPGAASQSSAKPPAGPARPSLRGVRAGDECGWQDVDSVETDSTGQRVRCTFEAGSYHWRALR